MSKHEMPRNERGERLCQFCHENTVRQSLGTKPVIYCSPSCKQRAYEARKTLRAVNAAVADAERRAAARVAKSQTLGAEDRPGGPAKSQTLPGNVCDFAEAEPQVSPSTSVTLPPDSTPPPPVLPLARSEAAQEAFTAAAVAKPSRRRSAITASAMPLPPAEPSPHGRAGGDRAGWLAAIDRMRPAAAEQQPALFEAQPDDEDQADA